MLKGFSLIVVLPFSHDLIFGLQINVLDKLCITIEMKVCRVWHFFYFLFSHVCFHFLTFFCVYWSLFVVGCIAIGFAFLTELNYLIYTIVNWCDAVGVINMVEPICEFACLCVLTYLCRSCFCFTVTIRMHRWLRWETVIRLYQATTDAAAVSLSSASITNVQSIVWI